MDYGEVISRGWKITWENKFLWILGFLAALGSSSSSSNSSNSASNSFENVDPEVLVAIGAAVALLICAGIFIGLIVWVVSLISQGGLIDAVARIDNGEKVTLGQAFRAGAQKIWRLMGVSIILYGLIFIAVIAIIALALFSIGGTAAMSALASDGDPEAIFGAMGIAAICICGLLCLMIPFMIIVGFIFPFSIRGVMLQDLGVMDAVRHGWEVLRTNAAEIIILSILFFVISIGYGLVVGLILTPLGLLLFAPLIAVGSQGIGMLEVIWLVLGSVGLLAIAAAAFSILTTWRSASFTLAYQHFIGKDKVVEPQY